MMGGVCEAPVRRRSNDAHAHSGRSGRQWSLHASRRHGSTRRAKS